MKDIPVFTTQYGIASLLLREIPYKALAFVRVQTVLPGMLHPLLEECIGFCRMVGAERILAAGAQELEEYPLHSIEYILSGPNPSGEPEANLWPVTEETVTQWRTIYNKGMGCVDNHATLTSFDEKKILSSGGAYFVHRDGQLLGIGWMEGSKLLAIVAAKPGMGRTVAKALFALTDEERITLEVVSTNAQAMGLYEKLGFIRTGEKDRWYRIL